MANKKLRRTKTRVDSTLPEWEQRLMMDTPPFIQNPDGSFSTHKMISFDNMAAPTIVMMDGKLKELSPEEAMDYAMKNRTYKRFKTPEEASDYANNGYKKLYPSKFPEGGTIYTSDPNDPRLKAYRDSLRLYKENFNQLKAEREKEHNIKLLSRIPFNAFKDNHYAKDAFERDNKAYVKSRGEVFPEKIKPVYFDLNQIIPNPKYGGVATTQHSAYYKKPVQPVVYQERQEQTTTSLQPDYTYILSEDPKKFNIPTRRQPATITNNGKYNITFQDGNIKTSDEEIWKLARQHAAWSREDIKGGGATVNQTRDTFKRKFADGGDVAEKLSKEQIALIKYAIDNKTFDIKDSKKAPKGVKPPTLTIPDQGSISPSKENLIDPRFIQGLLNGINPQRSGQTNPLGFTADMLLSEPLVAGERLLKGQGTPLEQTLDAATVFPGLIAGKTILKAAPQIIKKEVKDAAYRIFTQSPQAYRSKEDIVKALLTNQKGKYFGQKPGFTEGLIGGELYSKGERDLAEKYIFGTGKGFEPIDYTDDGIKGIKAYKMNSEIPHNQPIHWSDVARGLYGEQKMPLSQKEFRDLLDKELEKNPKLIFDVNPKDKTVSSRVADESIVNPVDDVAGHINVIEKKGEHYILTTRDRWGFDPKAYNKKYNLSNFWKKVQATAANKVGKPFALVQQNPISFLDEGSDVIDNGFNNGADFDFYKLIKEKPKFRDLDAEDPLEFGEGGGVMKKIMDEPSTQGLLLPTRKDVEWDFFPKEAKGKKTFKEYLIDKDSYIESIDTQPIKDYLNLWDGNRYGEGSTDGLEDAYRHSSAAALMAQNNGFLHSNLYGLGHELQTYGIVNDLISGNFKKISSSLDQIFDDPSAKMDLRNNFFGSLAGTISKRNPKDIAKNINKFTKLGLIQTEVKPQWNTKWNGGGGWEHGGFIKAETGIKELQNNNTMEKNEKPKRSSYKFGGRYIAEHGFSSHPDTEWDYPYTRDGRDPYDTTPLSDSNSEEEKQKRQFNMGDGISDQAALMMMQAGTLGKRPDGGQNPFAAGIGGAGKSMGFMNPIAEGLGNIPLVGKPLEMALKAASAVVGFGMGFAAQKQNNPMFKQRERERLWTEMPQSQYMTQSNTINRYGGNIKKYLPGGSISGGMQSAGQNLGAAKGIGGMLEGGMGFPSAGGALMDTASSIMNIMADKKAEKPYTKLYRTPAEQILSQPVQMQPMMSRYGNNIQWETNQEDTLIEEILREYNELNNRR